MIQFALMSIFDVVIMMQLSRATIYRLVSKGLFPPPIKVGRRSFWTPAQLQQFVVSVTPTWPTPSFRTASYRGLTSNPIQTLDIPKATRGASRKVERIAATRLGISVSELRSRKETEGRRK